MAAFEEAWIRVRKLRGEELAKPKMAYHGTSEKNIDSILDNGTLENSFIASLTRMIQVCWFLAVVKGSVLGMQQTRVILVEAFIYLLIRRYPLGIVEVERR